MKKMILTYSEYLDSLSKEEIERILIFFNIKYRKNSKKENLIKILVNSAEDITKYSLYVKIIFFITTPIVIIA